MHNARNRSEANKETVDVELQKLGTELRDIETRINENQRVAQEELNKKEKDLENAKQREIDALGKIAKMTVEEAKEQMMKNLKGDMTKEMAEYIRQEEEKAKEEVDKKAKELLIGTIQRYSTDHTSEATVTTVSLPNDDLKGRIIGREGRNIKTIETLTGIDLIRRATGDEVYGFTMPLVTDSQGKKFGKSEGNALWLDKTKTSSYKLYQFFVNVEDSMVIDYLKIYTFLSKEEIEEYEKKNNEHPELREAHKALAREIITFLHGREEYDRAEKLAQSLFNNDFANLTKQDITDLFDEQDMKNVESNISMTVLT